MYTPLSEGKILGVSCSLFGHKPSNENKLRMDFRTMTTRFRNRVFFADQQNKKVVVIGNDAEQPSGGGGASVFNNAMLPNPSIVFVVTAN